MDLATGSPVLLEVRIPGEPVAQASVVGGGRVVDADTGKVVRREKARYQNANDIRAWRRDAVKWIKLALRRAGGEWPLPQATAVELSCEFRLTRKPSVRRALPTVRPDYQHLVRAVEDALVMAGALTDDASITDSGPGRKRYATPDRPAGVYLTIRLVTAEEQLA